MRLAQVSAAAAAGTQTCRARYHVGIHIRYYMWTAQLMWAPRVPDATLTRAQTATHTHALTVSHALVAARRI